MVRDLSFLGLSISSRTISPTAPSFRPPSWPPPSDWVCVEDRDGNPVSRYGDHIWDFTPWCGKTETFNFGDGPRIHARSICIDAENAELLRQLVTWRGWGPRALVSARTLITSATRLRGIIRVCSENKIHATQLSRHPKVIDQVARILAPSSYGSVIAELDRLRDARSFLGFELLDMNGLQRLKAAQPKYSLRQTDYIPPRIWNYVVNRTAECIQDYLSHKSAIEECFNFCVNAYAENDLLINGGKHKNRNRTPFQNKKSSPSGSPTAAIYYGSFSSTARRFGIYNVVQRWVGRVDRVSVLTTYFHLVKYAALIDIVAFTLMRIDEAASVRWNCLRWVDDSFFGRIPLISAETTKTESDDQGIWICSPSVEPGVEALRSIARMRTTCLGKTSEDCPWLVTAALEPWGGGRVSAKQNGVRPSVPSLWDVIRAYPLLFDVKQLMLTTEDAKIARLLSSNQDGQRFHVGKPWPLAWHQFRRTGAVNMFAYGRISDSSIQLQMKHLTPWQSLYYGRGSTELHLNDSVRVILVNAQYEAMGRQLAEVHTNRYVSPYGLKHKARLLELASSDDPVYLISEADARHYETAARKQQISFRLTALGACMKNGHCDRDGMSSVSDCAGSNSEKACVNALFDRSRIEANKIRLDRIIQQLKITPLDTPRYRFLEQEVRGLENYFAYLEN